LAEKYIPTLVIYYIGYLQQTRLIPCASVLCFQKDSVVVGQASLIITKVMNLFSLVVRFEGANHQAEVIATATTKKKSPTH
jgi:hypothetical protein